MKEKIDHLKVGAIAERGRDGAIDLHAWQIESDQTLHVGKCIRYGTSERVATEIKLYQLCAQRDLHRDGTCEMTIAEIQALQIPQVSNLFW
jgi:hypothetical protein